MPKNIKSEKNVVMNFLLNGDIVRDASSFSENSRNMKEQVSACDEEAVEDLTTADGKKAASKRMALIRLCDRKYKCMIMFVVFGMLTLNLVGTLLSEKDVKKLLNLIVNSTLSNP